MSQSLMIQTAAAGLLVACMIVTFLMRFGRMRLWAPAFLLVVFVDQVAKWAVGGLVGEGRALPLAGGLLKIELAANGLQGFGACSTWVLPLTLVALVVSARLYAGLMELRYSMSRSSQVGCALLAGGLVGLAMDRIVRGHAVDFLAAAGGAFVYNLADIAAMAALAVFVARGVGLGLELWPRRAQIARRLAAELRG